MANIYIPALSPLAKALRGWPSAPTIPTTRILSKDIDVNKFAGLFDVAVIYPYSQELLYDKTGGNAYYEQGTLIANTSYSNDFRYGTNNVSFIRANSNSGYLNTNITIGIIFRITQDHTSDRRAFSVGWRQSASLSNEPIEIYIAANTGNIIYKGNNQAVSVDTGVSVTDGLTHSLGAVYKSGIQKVFLDGRLIYSGTTAFSSEWINSLILDTTAFYNTGYLYCGLSFLGFGFDENLAKEFSWNPNHIVRVNDTPYLVATSGGAASYTLTADSQSYALTGNAAPLTAARTLAATAQSYALTGNAATFALGYAMPADAQSYSLTGNAANFLIGYTLAADVQAYTATGYPALFSYDRAMTADTVAYSLTGIDATLDYSASAAPTLSAPVVTAVGRNTATVGCTVTF